jgi:anti-sigma regulatory factor (Ser/Thr protein kinase)
LLQTAETFRHEALLYAGEVDFLTGTLPFIREGVAADQPVLVVVSAAKIGLLRSALGADADRVAFADMADVGANPARAADLVLAVDELATNSLRHGGGRGTLRIWRDDGALVCEVRDAGRIEDPLAGRERPAVDRDGGQGLWMVNQLCDLVQLRTFPSGAVVRVHVYL